MYNQIEADEIKRIYNSIKRLGAKPVVMLSRNGENYFLEREKMPIKTAGRLLRSQLVELVSPHLG